MKDCICQRMEEWKSLYLYSVDLNEVEYATFKLSESTYSYTDSEMSKSLYFGSL